MLFGECEQLKNKYAEKEKELDDVKRANLN
jgi:hypothetical protein